MESQPDGTFARVTRLSPPCSHAIILADTQKGMSSDEYRG